MTWFLHWMIQWLARLIYYLSFTNNHKYLVFCSPWVLDVHCQIHDWTWHFLVVMMFDVACGLMMLHVLCNIVYASRCSLVMFVLYHDLCTVYCICVLCVKHGYLIDPGGSLNMHIMLIIHVPPLPTLHTLDCQAFSLQEAKLQSVTSGRNSLGDGFILDLPFFGGGWGVAKMKMCCWKFCCCRRPVLFLFLKYHEKKAISIHFNHGGIYISQRLKCCSCLHIYIYRYRLYDI